MTMGRIKSHHVDTRTNESLCNFFNITTDTHISSGTPFLHLEITQSDPLEIKNWKMALGLSENNFPVINSLKGMTGHCLAAAGSIECVA
jgi:hypothetical protein